MKTNPIGHLVKTNPTCSELVESIQTQLERSGSPEPVEWIKPNFKRGRLLIDPMLPLYKPGNVQYYSRHNFKVKFSKISIISTLIQVKSARYCCKIPARAAIFNPIKKLTVSRLVANLQK